MKKIKVAEYYCKECGSKLLVNLVGAEKYEEYYTCGTLHLYSKYDDLTGDRQYCLEYTCPNKKGLNFSGHTHFIARGVIDMGEYLK
jgi:hypothetical protein